MTSEVKVIDTAVRFLRTNPELIAYARAAAPSTGRSVDELLAAAVERARSVEQLVPEQQVVAGSTG